MRNIYNFTRKYWYSLGFLFIIILAAFLRFYNYENRWGLAYDQAHDAIIAKYSLEKFKFPLLGPFSSAGPFQTGGEWYWIIMMGTLFFPFLPGPWIFMTLIYVCFVFFIMMFGKEIVNKKFALLVGLLAAVSTAQIAQSTNLTNQSPQAIISLFVIWSMYKYVKTKKSIFLFLMGFCISLAASIHLQGASLFIFLFVTILSTGFPKPKTMGLLFFGILLPLLPIIIYDFNHGFFNSKNMIHYVFFNPNKISYEQLGRRWLTYIGVLWPTLWASVIGGYKIMGYIIIPFITGGIFFALLRKSIRKEWFIIASSLLAIVVFLRYIRTPIFHSYIVFLHPFILLLTAWLLFHIIKKQIVVGLLCIISIVMVSLIKDSHEIKNATNYMSVEAKYWRDLLINTYPDKKFAFYDYNYRSNTYSFPLVMYLYFADKLDDNGYKISFGIGEKEKPFHKMVPGNKMRFEFWDINASSSALLQKKGWVFINPSAVYRSTEEWQDKKQ